MPHQQDLNIIQRHIAGHASEKEQARVEDLFAKGADSSWLHKLLKEEWSSFPADPDMNLNPLLDRVHHIIRLKELKKQRSFRHRLVQMYARVAAILLVPVLLAGTWIYFRPGAHPEILPDNITVTSIYAPMGARVAFTLPDGSSGFLNSGSTLSYTSQFAGNRHVELHGEAWFDIAQDEQNPFEIDAGIAKVKVLGTSFNLSAYSDENHVEAVLASGSIEFEIPHLNQTITMVPEERLIFGCRGIAIEKTDPLKIKGWTEGKLIFRGDHISEVARRLERWYNIEVDVSDPALREYVFRGTFEDDSLTEVLRLLSMTSPIGYRISPRKLMPDGTWKKEKITLYRKTN